MSGVRIRRREDTLVGDTNHPTSHFEIQSRGVKWCIPQAWDCSQRVKRRAFPEGRGLQRAQSGDDNVKNQDPFAGVLARVATCAGVHSDMGTVVTATQVFTRPLPLWLPVEPSALRAANYGPVDNDRDKATAEAQPLPPTRVAGDVTHPNVFSPP